MSASSVLSVSLAEVLEAKNNSLKEAEVWSLLCSSAELLHELVLNGQLKTDFVFTPMSLMLTRIGRITLDMKHGGKPDSSYIPPEYISQQDDTCKDITKGALYSLGITMNTALEFKTLNVSISSDLDHLLNAMCDEDPNCRATLEDVLEECIVCAKQHTCGLSNSHYIMKMYQEAIGGSNRLEQLEETFHRRETLTKIDNSVKPQRTNAFKTGNSSLKNGILKDSLNPLDSLRAKYKRASKLLEYGKLLTMEDDEEFSDEDYNLSPRKKGSSSDPQWSTLPKNFPHSHSPELNNSKYLNGELKPADITQSMKSLYFPDQQFLSNRVVNSTKPSKKREYTKSGLDCHSNPITVPSGSVFNSELILDKTPQRHNLSIFLPRNVSNTPKLQVRIYLFSEDILEGPCPGDVLVNQLQTIIFNFLRIPAIGQNTFALSFIQDNRQFFLDHKETVSSIYTKFNSSSDRKFDLQLNFAVKFYPPLGSLHREKHIQLQLYKQLHCNILSAKYVIQLNEAIYLAALAIQVDHADSVLQGGTAVPASVIISSVDLNHYLAADLQDKFYRDELMKELLSKYQSVIALGRDEAQITFIESVQKLPYYGCHFYELPSSSNSSEDMRLFITIDVCMIQLMEKKDDFFTTNKSCVWSSVKKVAWENNRFVVWEHSFCSPSIDVCITDSYLGSYLCLLSKEHQLASLQYLTKVEPIVTESKKISTNPNKSDAMIWPDVDDDDEIFIDYSSDDDEEEVEDNSGKIRFDSSTRGDNGIKMRHSQSEPAQMKTNEDVEDPSNQRYRDLGDMRDLEAVGRSTVSERILNQEEKYMARVNVAFEPDSFEENWNANNPSHVSFNLESGKGSSPDSYQRYTISLIKKDGSLGLRVSGGSDTNVEDGCIVIKSIISGGPADTNRSISVGDRLTSLNGVNLMGLKHKEAVDLLCQAPDHVTLVLERPLKSSKSEERITTSYKEFETTLIKPTEGGLGFAIGEYCNSNEQSCFIKSIIQDPALSDGVLKPEDKLVSVNGVDMRNMNKEEAVEFLRSTCNEVHIRVLREETELKNDGSDYSIRSHVDINDNQCYQISEEFSEASNEFSTEYNYIKVKIKRSYDRENLGLSIVSTNKASTGITIKTILDNGLAHKSNSIEPGDELVEINGQTLAGMNSSDVSKLLRTAGLEVALTIKRKSVNSRLPRNPQIDEHNTSVGPPKPPIPSENNSIHLDNLLKNVSNSKNLNIPFHEYSADNSQHTDDASENSTSEYEEDRPPIHDSSDEEAESASSSNKHFEAALFASSTSLPQLLEMDQQGDRSNSPESLAILCSNPLETIDEDFVAMLPLVHLPADTAVFTKQDLHDSLEALAEWTASSKPYTEYQELRLMDPAGTNNDAKLLENARKNRYRNVLPYDHTRVRLKDIETNEPPSDYINASHIRLDLGSMIAERSITKNETNPFGSSIQPLLLECISCQGPLPTTTADFWQMVVEQGVKIVVMVTKEVEMSRVKCHSYWPDDINEPLDTDRHLIKLEEVTVLSNFILRRLSIHSSDGSTHLVLHAAFSSWPDHDVPSTPLPILKFLSLLRLIYQGLQHPGPLLVHCSAGIGRTGALVAIHAMMTLIEAGQPITFENNESWLFRIITELRKQREGMVQTQNQYLFCYQAVREVLLSLTKDTASFRD